MTLWEIVLHSVKEELESLKLRKKYSPNQRSIDSQISDAESRLEEAKQRLIKTE